MRIGRLGIEIENTIGLVGRPIPTLFGECCFRKFFPFVFVFFVCSIYCSRTSLILLRIRIVLIKSKKEEEEHIIYHLFNAEHNYRILTLYQYKNYLLRYRVYIEINIELFNKD